MNESVLPHKPQDYACLYVDMNAFFASVEQQERPELRGRPVAVAPCLGRNCSIVAASYEAREFGIGVGTKIGRALELCPPLTIVSGNATIYRDYHRRIMEVLHNTYCRIGAKSIDEAYLLIPSYGREIDHVLTLIEGVSTRFKSSLGEYIKCSIGVAPNIWLAKMAAQSKKPNGRVVLCLEDLHSFYRGMPLVQCTGIGRRMARRLYAVGVSDVADLASRSLPFMRSQLGVVGEKWYLRLRGYEVDQNPNERKRKSISHQVTVLGNRQLSFIQARDYVIALVQRLATRLHSYGLYSGGVGLFIAYNQRPGVYKYYEVGQSLTGYAAISTLALQLLEEAWIESEPVRLFALSLTQLTEVQQIGLPIAESWQQRRDQALSRAIDVLNRRYGPKTIRAHAGLQKDLVPDRVGFGNL